MGAPGATKARGYPAVAAGGDQVCAVLADNTGSCWGNNDRGQLGGGQTGTSRTPAAILDKSGAPVTDLASLSVGSEQACARAADGAISCWGAGDSGALGNGQSGDRMAPTPARLAARHYDLLNVNIRRGS